ncbi:MAG TPA: DNA primase [Ktedonobacterales bacterium]
MSTVIEQIKNKLDIVAEIGAVVPLRQSGKAHRGICPFHGERTPSFYVFPQTATWRCFGCNEGGDLIAFVEKQQGLDFKDALALLAERAGVTLDSAPVSSASVAEASARKRLRALNESAAIWFHAQMLQSPAAQYARSYLAARGVSNETLTQWRLGFAPDADELSRYLLTQGYTDRELIDAGLARQREPERGGGLFDFFRGRIVFPIRDARGATIAFGGRELGGGQPKYLNTPQTLLFEKSATLFGLDMAREAIRKQDHVIIVEGYMDVIVPSQEGTRNIVAVIGSAVTEKHIQAIKKLTRRVVLALDPDAAGDSAATRGIMVAQHAFDRVAIPVVGPAASSGHEARRGGPRGSVRLEEQVDADIRVARLPRGVDPDELSRQDPAAWQQAIASAVPLVDFLFDVWTADLPLDTPQGKLDACRRLLPVIAEVRSRTLAGEYVDRLAMKLRLDVRDLQRELALTRQQVDREARQRLLAQRDRPPQTSEEPEEGDGRVANLGYSPSTQPESATYSFSRDASHPTSRAGTSVMSPGEISPEKHCLGMLLAFPETWQEIGAILDEGDFTSSDSRALFGVLAGMLSQGCRDPDELMGYLTSPLLELATVARGRVSAEEPPDTPMLLKEASQAAFRVKKGRLRAELAEIDALLREAESERDEGAVRDLLGRKQRLLSERRTLDRASPLQA